MSLCSLQGKHNSLMTPHNENQIGMSVECAIAQTTHCAFLVLNNVLASIVRQFVNVRWQTLATVLQSQRCQRCYRHSCNRRCVVHHSHSPIQRLNPAFYGQKTADDTKSQRHTLPCLPLVTPLRKALLARGPGPSTVLPSSWATFGQICLSDDWLG